VRERYFDYAATAPLDRIVLAAMQPWLGEHFGNAHSLHHWGRSAHVAVESARESIATSLQLEDPQEVIFTSGATEACALALNAFDEGIMSPFEHSAVAALGAAKGFKRLAWNEDHYLTTDPCAVEATMSVSNETGMRLPRSGSGKLRFADSTQAIGKVPFEWSSVDAIALSAHKLYGPTGVGLLAAKPHYPVEPIQMGGGQEMGRRGGTLNVAGIVGMAVAIELAVDRQEEDWHRATELRQIVLDELDAISDWQPNAIDSVPHILSIGFRGLTGETLVVEMDQAGFGISAGAACSSRSTELSPGLLALGIEESLVKGTVRISFGRYNTTESAALLGKSLVRCVRRLRELHKT